MTKLPKVNRTVVLTGGGSGGHVYPVIQIVQAIHVLDPTVRFVYLGQHGGPERDILGAAKLPFPVPFYSLTADKLRRYWDVRTLFLPWAVATGTFQAFVHLARIRPSVVLCKGGYVSLPVALAARLRSIPIVLHETDAVMGLANRLIAPFAQRIAVSFPRQTLSEGSRSYRKLIYTGQPVSVVFTKRSVTNLDPDRPHLLITGGSQGSVAINSLILDILPTLLERYRVTHLTGQADFHRFQARQRHRFYTPIASVATARGMAALMAEADLVISRAGGTIFELAAMSKPTILIPLPNAGNDHQLANAQILAGNDAAVLLEQAATSPADLLRTINELIHNSTRRAALARHLHQFARPDAATQVARLVLEVMRSAT